MPTGLIVPYTEQGVECEVYGHANGSVAKGRFTCKRETTLTTYNMAPSY